MKFGQYLDIYKIPEWSEEYIDYAGLKAGLEAILKGSSVAWQNR